MKVRLRWEHYNEWCPNFGLQSGLSVNIEMRDWAQKSNWQVWEVCWQRIAKLSSTSTCFMSPLDLAPGNPTWLIAEDLRESRNDLRTRKERGVHFISHQSQRTLETQYVFSGNNCKNDAKFSGSSVVSHEAYLTLDLTAASKQNIKGSNQRKNYSEVISIHIIINKQRMTSFVKPSQVLKWEKEYGIIKDLHVKSRNYTRYPDYILPWPALTANLILPWPVWTKLWS